MSLRLLLCDRSSVSYLRSGMFLYDFRCRLRDPAVGRILNKKHNFKYFLEAGRQMNNTEGVRLSLNV